MITLDGAMGEGGGQVLRSALGLSLATGLPFRISNIRANRKKPGLLHQHLTAVMAAADIGGAELVGANLRSRELVFRPTGLFPGSYHHSIGTAGSTSLVLQAILPGLLTARSCSHLVLEGGTHNPFAPPFDFLRETFIAFLQKSGPMVTIDLIRPGFYPAGGGIVEVAIQPVDRLARVDLLERGPIKSCVARALVSNLPRHIAEREVRAIEKKLRHFGVQSIIEELTNSPSVGNTVQVEIMSQNLTEVFTGFGRKGVPAELVAADVAREAREYLSSDAPVGRHLADQILLPMALAGGGAFRTLPLSRHTTTNIDVIRGFLDVDIRVTEVGRNTFEVSIIS